MIDSPTTPEKISEAAMMANTERKTMTTEELRELDAWIAEHVMEWLEGRSGLQSRHDPSNDSWVTLKHSYRFKHSWKPTVDPADAMQVLERIQDKLDCEDVAIGRCHGMEWAGGEWYLYSIYRENRSEIGQWRVNGPTLPLAICLFAKELFSK